MTRSPACRGLLTALLVLTTAGALSAQEFRATVKGQVTDPSRAAVPGATVTVVNQDTNETATTVSNTEGTYSLPFLRPGLYTLNVEMSGFQKHIRKDMRLEVSQIGDVNVQLAVGGVAEQMTVSAESPLLETSKADRGTVIDSQRIAELPLQSRSPMALTVLVAGVNYNAQAIYLRPFDNGALADWSMNGGAEPQQRVPARRRARTTPTRAATTSPTSRRPTPCRSSRSQTNSYDAQYGRTAGGVVNMSLKSGHQQLPRHRLRVLPPQVARRELVPAELAQHAEDRSLPRSVRLRGRRPGEDPRPVQRQEQDVLHVQRREVPRRARRRRSSAACRPRR